LQCISEFKVATQAAQYAELKEFSRQADFCLWAAMKRKAPFKCLASRQHFLEPSIRGIGVAAFVHLFTHAKICRSSEFIPEPKPHPDDVAWDYPPHVLHRRLHQTILAICSLIQDKACTKF